MSKQIAIPYSLAVTMWQIYQFKECADLQSVKAQHVHTFAKPSAGLWHD